MALTKLTTNLISGDIVTSVNGASGAVTVSTGTDWVTAIQTANFTSVASKGYFVNTTSAEVTITLPVGAVGDEIVIQDYAGTFATNKVILAANGSEKIQGSTDEFRCIIKNSTVTLIYQDATKGWTASDIELDINTVSWVTPIGQSFTYTLPSPASSSGTSGSVFPSTTFTTTNGASILSGTASVAGLPTGITITSQSYNNNNSGNILTITLNGVFPSTDVSNVALTISGLTSNAPTVTANYLVIAGGGGGGRGEMAGSGAGGGAGGLRTSFGSVSGGGNTAESAISGLTVGTDYTVTVGAGGIGRTTTQGYGGDGNGSTFLTISTIGGGGAAYANSSGRSGGSGGGGGIGCSTGGVGTTNQGRQGGGAIHQGPNYPCGGGGGAASTPSCVSSGSGIAGGGAGLQINTGATNTAYAGGGAMGKYPTSNVGGWNNNGIGGGGGYPTSGGSMNQAVINTGSGGGGSSTSNAGNGASGIVTISYSHLITCSNPAGGLTFTTTTVGTNNITVFTSGTGDIQFN